MKFISKLQQNIDISNEYKILKTDIDKQDKVLNSLLGKIARSKFNGSAQSQPIIRQVAALKDKVLDFRQQLKSKGDSAVSSIRAKLSAVIEATSKVESEFKNLK